MNKPDANNESIPMNKWIIVLVAHDDPELQPQVLAEQIANDEDEELAAFVRGGELVDVLVGESPEAIEARRVEVERTSLRLR